MGTTCMVIRGVSSGLRMTIDLVPLPNLWQDAVIEQIEVATPTVKTFVLRPQTWRAFLPGQHIDVRLTAPDGYEAHRSYSIASAPDDSGMFQLAIEVLERGEVSPYFHEVAAIGDTIEVRGPFTTHFVAIVSRWCSVVGGGRFGCCATDVDGAASRACRECTTDDVALFGAFVGRGHFSGGVDSRGKAPSWIARVVLHNT